MHSIMAAQIRLHRLEAPGAIAAKKTAAAAAVTSAATEDDGYIVCHRQWRTVIVAARRPMCRLCASPCTSSGLVHMRISGALIMYYLNTHIL